MKNNIPFYFLLLLPSIAASQGGGTKTNNLGNEDINVVKEYQPVLNDAFKINIYPESDTSTFRDKQSLNYSLEARPMNSNYNTSPIKPVRIKDDAIKKLYHGFVKAGYGLENMPLLDVSFNSIRSKNFDAGVRYKHLSTSGKIKDYGFPGNSNNHIDLFGTRYFEKFKLGADLIYNRNVVHFYGFKTPPELFSKSETKHSMSDVEGSVKLQSLDLDKDKWRYQSALSFYNFSDNRKASENNAVFSIGGSKLMNNATFILNASGEFGKIEQESFSFNRSIIRFRPRFNITQDLFSIDIGANLALESNNNNSDYRLYPYVKAEYQVINDAVKIFAELSGDLQRNDLRSFSRQNPFFGSSVPLANTNQRLGLSGGASIKLEHDLMFTGIVNWARLKNQPFFINNFEIPTTFSVYYDKATLLQLKGSLEYKQSEKIAAGISVEYNNYNTDKLKEQLYIPAFRLGFNSHYAIAEKIFIKADLFYNSNITGIEYTSVNSVVTSDYKNLKGWMDANIGIDYRYSKVLSAFVSLNNIGFAQYFRWYQYPSYRLLGLAGITYSF